MPQKFIWVHEDALTYHHPVFEVAAEADKAARAIFVWDATYFERQNYSLKRLTFIYECLVDLRKQESETPIEIFCGDTQTVLAGLTEQAAEDKSAQNAYGKAALFLADTPNPAFLAIADKLSQNMSVEIVQNVSFIEAPDDVDMTRFFRFWNRSRRSALGFDNLRD